MEPGICIYIRKLLDNGRKRVNQLHKVISNRNINLSARRLLLLSVIRPSIEYGSENVERASATRARESRDFLVRGIRYRMYENSVIVWSAIKTQDDAGIYDSCWYLRRMLVFTLHAGIVNTSMKCKYQHEP